MGTEIATMIRTGFTTNDGRKIISMVCEKCKDNDEDLFIIPFEKDDMFETTCDFCEAQIMVPQSYVECEELVICLEKLFQDILQFTIVYRYDEFMIYVHHKHSHRNIFLVFENNNFNHATVSTDEYNITDNIRLLDVVQFLRLYMNVDKFIQD